MQKFFEKYPELISGKDYVAVIPQAMINRPNSGEIWRADFILKPHNNIEFAKIIEFKVPSINFLNKPHSDHLTFSSKILRAIQQPRDYGSAFESKETRTAFKKKYDADIYYPDLHLIAGRRPNVTDVQILDSFKRQIKNIPVIIEDWDSFYERLRRNFE